MRILAISDVHYPRFADDFMDVIKNHERPDLFLMAGDMVNRGDAEGYVDILNLVEDQFGTDLKIIGCFGNEEYSEVRKQIISIIGKRMEMLDEKKLTLTFDELQIGIVGTQGSLDKPTSWQRGNIPGIREKFARRADRASTLLKKLVGTVDRRILLMHHSPCTETCKGEDVRSFAWLGSRKFYTVVKTEQPDLVIHGHVHNSIVHEAKVGATLIRNVALPAVGDITKLDLW